MYILKLVVEEVCRGNIYLLHCSPQNEKLRQIQKEREQTIRLMLEEEQRYVDALRSDLARSPGDEKKNAELTNAKRNVSTLQNQLQAILVGGQNANSEVRIMKSVMYNILEYFKIKKNPPRLNNILTTTYTFLQTLFLLLKILENIVNKCCQKC